jgi:hypothetical protein
MALRRMCALSVGLVIGLCLWPSAPALADYYDNFSDGDAAGDPNGWDVDNPTWQYGELIGTYFQESVQNNALRLFVDNTFYPAYFLGAYVDDGGMDPNTSATWWDDTTDHYFLCKAYNTGALTDPVHGNDPNWDKGSFSIMFHGSVYYWTSYSFKMDLDNKAPGGAGGPTSPWPPNDQHKHYLGLKTGNGLEQYEIQRAWLPENDPNWADVDTWEREGVWLLIQFTSNGVTGDPNGKWLKAAIWPGDKYNWNGKYLLSVELSGTWYDNDVNRLDWYWPEGVSVLGALSDDEWTSGNPDVAYTGIEARTGVFTNVPCRLRLTVAHDPWGTIVVNPDLRDPTDPNLPADKLMRYTKGTKVVLSATAIAKKAFDKWMIYDPNYPNDPNHAIADSNAILHLTMDQDYQVQAVFKCASGVEPLLVVGLAALALVAIIRRLS